MCKEDLIDIPQCPGIYKIQNIKNNKCYIGQSINLHKRLFHHINNYLNKRYNAPIYKAFEKYGIDNFSITILKTFDNPVTDKTKKLLDQYEQYYIKEFNSFGSTGYNQTYGGDGGIKGYKFTESQKQQTSKISLKIQNDGRHSVYCYDIINNELIYETSLSALKRKLNINFRNGCINDLLVQKQYIISRDKDILNQKINKYKDKIQEFNTNGCSKLTVDIKNDILSGISEKDCCEKYNICKSTFYHYKDKLRNWGIV